MNIELIPKHFSINFNENFILNVKKTFDSFDKKTEKHSNIILNITLSGVKLNQNKSYA
jgi:hypothetical protein